MGDNGKKDKKSKGTRSDIKLQELTALRNQHNGIRLKRERIAVHIEPHMTIGGRRGRIQLGTGARDRRPRHDHKHQQTEEQASSAGRPTRSDIGPRIVAHAGHRSASSMMRSWVASARGRMP